MSHPILIVGAGPGGLCAAVALQQAGVPVRVLERSPTLRTAGAGLTVQVNAMRMLALLGLAEKATAAGARLRQLTVEQPDGTALTTMAFPTEQPSIGIHRGDMSRILADALDPGTLRFDAAVSDVHATDDHVDVILESGEIVRGAGVVAADGIHSAVRKAVFGPTELRYAGYTCWRGIAEVGHPAGRGAAFERWGAGRRFGVVPISEHRTYWFATSNAPAGGTDGDDVMAEVTERFKDFAQPVSAVIRATPRSALLRNDIIDLPPRSTWTSGRVTLLGDAAHAMTPNMGQGACQAIEDGVVLAAHVVGSTDLATSFLAYEADRRPRATEFVNKSWTLGKTAQWEGRLARALRDTVTRWTPDSWLTPSVRRTWDVSVPEHGRG